MTNLANASIEDLEAALAAKKAAQDTERARAAVKHNLENEPLPKMEAKHIFHVDSSDFEEWIRNVFGVKSFEMVAIEEWGNDQTHEFHVIHGNDDNTPEETKQTEDFLYGGQPCRMWGVSSLFNYLGDMKLLPAGEYHIRVCW